MVREQLLGELGKGQALPLARGWRGDVHILVVCLGNDAIQQQLNVVDFDLDRPTACALRIAAHQHWQQVGRMNFLLVDLNLTEALHDRLKCGGMLR